MSFSMRLRVARKYKYDKAKDFVKDINKDMDEERMKLLNFNDKEYKHLAYTTYVAYEIGNREPRYTLLARMAKILDVSTDYLLEMDKNVQGELHERILRDFICLFDVKSFWGTKKTFYLIMRDNSLLILDANVCYEIIDKMKMSPQNEIIAKLSEQLDTVKKQHLNKKLSYLSQCLASVAAADLLVDYQVFCQGFSQLSWVNKPLFLTSLDGLCFYYFTGIDPSVERQKAINIVKVYNDDIFMDETDLKKIEEELEEELKDILDNYEPPKRLEYLEAYVASRNNLDYVKYRDKFKKGISGFRNLQRPFLDSFRINCMRNLSTLCYTPDLYNDVVTAESKGFFQEVYNWDIDEQKQMASQEYISVDDIEDDEEAMKKQAEEIEKELEEEKAEAEAKEQAEAETALALDRAKRSKNKKGV